MNMKNEMSPEEASRELDKGMVGADTLRADELAHLSVLRQAKDTSLRNEQARLSQKLGPDHPRVVEINDRLELNAGIMRDLGLEVARARTEIPQVDENSWALHGYVRDQGGKGVSNLTVALYDQNGSRLENLGHACTAGNGYFRIVARASQSLKDSVAYIRVLSPQSSFLYADKNALTPQPGAIDYREITLSGEETVCVAPPEPTGTSTLTPPTVNPFSPPTIAPGKPPPNLDQTQDLTPPRDYWVVRGRVTDKAGKGLSGLFVSVYDEDLFFDDRLGQAKTDQNGNYSLTYRTDDFRDLIEKKPDLYLKVIDRQGRSLYVLKGHIWYESGRAETIDIEIG